MGKVFCFFLLIPLSLFAAESKKFSFMPENDLHKTDSLLHVSQISEQEFNAIIDEVSSYYKPIVEAHGAHLKVRKKWKDPTVNAYALRSGNFWEVHFFGGMARRKEITKDGFQLVVCHELGHHLGGYPFVDDDTWAANDGQSDYFSTLSCAREIWKKQYEKNKEAASSVIPFAKGICDKAWKDKDERYLCYRVLNAGKSLSDLLSASTAKFETPDKKVVRKTISTHPEPQCRLDTYVAGSICHARFDVSFIPSTQQESFPYTCFESNAQKGYRPKCWFKEEGL